MNRLGLILCGWWFTVHPSGLFAGDGGMTGGGGGLVRDRNNPWFLHNTTVVKYCVEFDTEHFSGDQTKALNFIDDALRYWKEEFRSATSPVYSPGLDPIRVATQNFVKVDCTAAHDVDFQFGFVRQDQRSDIPHPEDFAGAAIRTSYDPVQMRGKGYIYIAADRGSGRYKGAPSELAEFWSCGRGTLLFHTLVHELGHLFGLQHFDDTVMDERYVEEIMAKSDFYGNAMDVSPFFKFSAKSFWNYGIGSRTQSIPQKTSRFFGVPSDTRGIYFEQTHANHLAVVIFDAELKESVAGIIYLEQPNAKNYSNAQKIYVPQESSVFRFPAHLGVERLLDGPQIEFEMRSGRYISSDGSVNQPLVIGLKPSGPAANFLGGVIGGAMDVNILDIQILGGTRSKSAPRSFREIK